MPSWSEEDLANKLKENPDLKKALNQGNPLPRLAKALEAQEHKYHIAPKEARTYNGIVYHSKREAEFAQQLDFRKQAGEIDFWLRQISLPLPGGTEYRVDFVTYEQVADTPLYEVHWIEAKGYKIRLGEIKRKQAEEIYGIVIEVV